MCVVNWQPHDITSGSRRQGLKPSHTIGRKFCVDSSSRCRGLDIGITLSRPYQCVLALVAAEVASSARSAADDKAELRDAPGHFHFATFLAYKNPSHCWAQVERKQIMVHTAKLCQAGIKPCCTSRSDGQLAGLVQLVQPAT